MYDDVIPVETRQRLATMERAGVVVGLPSYRNADTVGELIQRLAAGLATYYSHEQPLIVHVDGHDDALAAGRQSLLPPTVRRVSTSYNGVSGKGSALRAIFEVATLLEAKALLIVEADVTSLNAAWVSSLIEPVLQNRFDLVLPLYQHVQPEQPASDLITYPLLSAMFQLAPRYPAGGDVAMSGGVAAYFRERDVWETDVARAGVDLWMTSEVALEGGRLTQVPVGPKQHRSHDSFTLSEAKFLQEIGTLFRLGLLQERVWRKEIARHPIPAPHHSPTPNHSSRLLPDPAEVWKRGKQAIRADVPQQWKSILTPGHYDDLQKIVQQPAERPNFDPAFWARLVYDFLVVYNQGEGDPDKVVTALYPLCLLRHSALLAQVIHEAEPLRVREQLIEQQRAAFHETLPYLHHRWESYISPEQLALWRELGLVS